MRYFVPRTAIWIVCLLTGTVGAAGEDDPWFAAGLTGPVSEERPLQRSAPREDAPSEVKGDVRSNAIPGWLRTTLSLTAVVTLIVVLGFFSRRFPFIHRGKGRSVIEVISRTSLSAKQTLCLVRIGPRMVLIGAAGDRLTRLDVIDDPELTAELAGMAQQTTGRSSTRAFSERLDDEAVAYAIGDGDERDADEQVSGPRLLDIKRKLAGTIRRLKAKRSA